MYRPTLGSLVALLQISDTRSLAGIQTIHGFLGSVVILISVSKNFRLESGPLGRSMEGNSGDRIAGDHPSRDQTRLIFQQL